MRKLLLLALIALFILPGCGSDKEAGTKAPLIVKTEKVESFNTISKDYVGVAKSDLFSNLAFLVGGQIIKMNVSDGQYVKRGELIAQIDQNDIKLELEAYRSNYSTTKSVMERNKRLLEKQAISQQDFEIAETQFILARANYEGARNKLSYTYLKAPFDGVIEKKFVENYQKVNPGQGVVRLVQPSELLVWFTVPDNDLEFVRSNPTFSIEFDAFKGRFFNAIIKELIDTSPDGTGIPVSLVIKDTLFKEFKSLVKPGFSARVVMKIEKANFPASYVVIPMTALFTEPRSNEQSVWVLAADNTVTRKAVDVEFPSGTDQVVVSSGIEVGDIVISAGVNRISEGEQVNVLN